MATKTGTKATSGAVPREIHAGSISVLSKYDFSTDSEALSAGDVVQMVKIPHGAIIDGLTINGPSVGDTKVVIQVGDGDDTSRFYGSASLSLTVGQTIVVTEGIGYQYDFSDDAAQYDTIDIVIGTVTSATATGTLSVLVSYHCDESDPQ